MIYSNDYVKPCYKKLRPAVAIRCVQECLNQTVVDGEVVENTLVDVYSRVSKHDSFDTLLKSQIDCVMHYYYTLNGSKMVSNAELFTCDISQVNLNPNTSEQYPSKFVDKRIHNNDKDLESTKRETLESGSVKTALEAIGIKKSCGSIVKKSTSVTPTNSPKVVRSRYFIK